MLKQAIDLATWAPNAGNQQVWHFYVVLNKKTINAIADVVQATADHVSKWPEAAKLGEVAGRMAQRSSFFRGAPAAIAVAAKQYVTPTEQIVAGRAAFDAEAKRIQEGRAIANARIQSVGSVVGYLVLILHQMGLGAIWMTGPMQAKSEIEKILNVPKEMDLVAFVPVGYAAEAPVSTGRRPVAEVCDFVR